MALDMIKWLERKILLFPASGQEFRRELRKKREEYFASRDDYEQLRTLNSSDFYSENEIENKWVLLKPCLEEKGQYQSASAAAVATSGGANPNLEVVGNKTDLKGEKKVDLFFKKNQAALSI
mmetsp:Transcript_37132/g.56983  ORF Transcript_37132/g.56983 Transcript_37132/m.56983 type:complete len:122 (+) Transcript_37132:1281-1646(+)